PLAQCAPRLIGESNTGSWRTHTPFSTTASIAQPTEQCVQTVRLTSTRPSPMAGPLLSAALAFLTRVSEEAARPTPTPRPERRRNARRSMVGRAEDSPRCRLWTNGERGLAAAAPDFFVSNMVPSGESDQGGLVVLPDVFRHAVAAALRGSGRGLVGLGGAFALHAMLGHDGGGGGTGNGGTL